MTEPERVGFRSGELYGSVIAVPLLERMQQESKGTAAQPHRVVIDLHFDYPKGRDEARKAVLDLIKHVVDASGAASQEGVDQEGVDEERNQRLSQYLVAWLTSPSIREVVRLDREAGQSGSGSAIYRIWPDFRTRALINRSAATVKADAARTAFTAIGTGMVWAVVDSGIAGDHPHFAAYQTLSVSAPVSHQDFTGGKSPLTDEFGHGTHVAGILAGGLTETAERPLTAVRAERDHDNNVTYRPEPVTAMSGMAPACRLVSYKVLGAKGDGDVSAIIAALQDIQQVNSYGRDIKIHGVNLSVGYPFDPKWFACGQSPVCVEVTRLVQSGVVVVVAAGNTGYGYEQDFFKGAVTAGMDLTINDPGNAEQALTVGSTHRDMPHQYGVSYFSSKGPTGDGRVKPDLVAPGERILSCAAGSTLADVLAKPGVGAGVDYVEDSGTSMSAAHVSGVIAAFLSIRREFIGCPTRVKDVFTGTATDLGRITHFQGHGLIDLMRAIQSV